MAGREINTRRTNLAAVFNGKKDPVAGFYASVLWTNDTFPILTGGKLVRVPTLYAEILDPWLEGSNWHFLLLQVMTMK